jgi:hypothetical protein
MMIALYIAIGFFGGVGVAAFCLFAASTLMDA